MESVSWPQVLAWRMRRQFIDRHDAPSALEVARRLAGVQAQVASSAALAVAIRRSDPEPGETAHALWERRSLVKTWAMRGTLHLLPADETPAYMALCGTLRYWERPSWQRVSGATTADVEAIAAAAASALSGGAVLTREELNAAIIEETGSTHLAEVLGSGWGMLLKPLAWWGVLVHGPLQGTRVTFSAPEHTIPGWKGLPSLEDAARIVIPAFLGAHGPATPEAFDNWLTRKSSRKRDLKAWFAAADDLLTTVEVEGEEMYVPAELLDDLLATPPAKSVRLLGGFDPYVLGTGTGATYLVPAEHRPKVSRTAGWISPVVLYEGRVAGVWEPGDDGPDITPFEEIPPRPLQEEITRVRPFIGTG
jgi:hypothetical protein